MELIKNIALDKFEIDFGSQFIRFPRIELNRDNFPTKVVGQNGSGKTSLILSLAGVIPDYIYGRPEVDFKITSNKGISIFPKNQELFRIIPQKWQHGLLGFYPIEEINLVRNHDIKWKKEILDTLEIDSLNNISSVYLSDGEKKRIMICKTLCSFPSLIISDEWTTHLDSYWISKIQKLFDLYTKDGGFHLEFHCDDSDINSRFLLETKRTNSEYLRDISIDYDFVKTIIENSFNPSEFDITHNVRYYGNNQSRSLELNFESGELILLLGKNGAGKTTLIRNLWKDSFYFYRKIVKNNFKLPKLLYIPSDPSYHIMGPTIKNEYVRILGKVSKLSAKLFIENLLGVNEDNDVLGLSYGQRKMLAITLGLCSSYSIICIDEPFSGLDNSNRKIVLELIKITINSGKTILLADQDDKYFLNSKIFQL